LPANGKNSKDDAPDLHQDHEKDEKGIRAAKITVIEEIPQSRYDQPVLIELSIKRCKQTISVKPL